MIKECPITINNKAVTVCMYDDVAVQFPSIHDMKKTSLLVECKNNRYHIMEEDKVSDESEAPVSKKGAKSETK